MLHRLKGDPVIWLIVLVLAVFSVLAVYSSTGSLAYRFHDGNTEYYLVRHFIILAFGLLVLFGAHMIHYKYYSRLSQLLLFISVPLLAITLFIGQDVHDAQRWLTLPMLNLTFQPSDLAKLAMIMFLARMLSKKQDVVKDFRKTFLPLLLGIITVCLLIAPADLSTATLLFVTCLILMFIGRVNMKHMGVFILAGTLAFSALIGLFSMTSYEGRMATWENRIESFFAEDQDSYQNQQAKIAIAEGGIIGKGPGNSTQRNLLPNPFSDFVYAIIIEEYGMIGGAFVLFLFLLLLYRTIMIVVKSPRAFGAFLSFGLALSLVIQAIVNMAVSVHLLPVTGLVLPFLSMGGTSLIFTCVAFGIILSVSRDIEENETEPVENTASA